MPIDDCRVVSLPQISDSRGYLSVVEGGRHVPFDIARVYYLYDVPQGVMRGAHGHKELEQLIIAVHGSFSLVLNDGHEKNTYHLERPDVGIYVAPMMWREILNMSDDAVCLVLASLPYDEGDYYREYERFLQAVKDPAK